MVQNRINTVVRRISVPYRITVHRTVYRSGTSLVVIVTCPNSLFVPRPLAEAASGFIARARAWWADYVRLSMQEFKHRPVKVCAHICVCVCVCVCEFLL